MVSLLRRSVIEAEDWLRYHPVVRGVLGRYRWWREARAAPRDHQQLARSIRNLCAAARLSTDSIALGQIHQRILERLGRLDAKRVNWTEFVPDVDEPWLPRAAVLKPYGGPREPGVLYSAFEVEWVKLLRHADLNELAARYTLVLAPSSSPYNLANYVLPAAWPAPLFTQISNAEDRDILPRIAARFRVLPLYASHWVNPDLYRPRPRGERDIDLIMVAAFGKVKRHHALFRALRRMPRSLRILLVGQDQEGRTADTIRAEARSYAVAARFEVLSNAGHEQVVEALGRARASVLLSRREGSAVVIAESLFADTPAALLRGAQVGSRALLNDQTGRLLDERDLAAELLDFLDHTDRYRPREWAEANVSCFRSSERLNAILRDHARAQGQEWTTDIAPLCWRPDPRLVHPEDERRTEAERRYFLERFGLALGPLAPSRAAPGTCRKAASGRRGVVDERS
jgi:glycosyltransferase involved in cell wall biosynthesis